MGLQHCCAQRCIEPTQNTPAPHCMHPEAREEMKVELAAMAKERDDALEKIKQKTVRIAELKEEVWSTFQCGAPLPTPTQRGQVWDTLSLPLCRLEDNCA